jgi:choline-sulfatase
MLQQVVAAFADRPAAQRPIFVVTADHGEALGEHGQPYHSTDLYNAQIRVPFVIAGPAIGPRRISETVSGTDLVPTLIDLAGFSPPAGPAIDGRSLADLVLGLRAPAPDGGFAFAAMIRDRSNPGGVTAVVQGRWKLIETHDRLELYDTRTDPDERTNVYNQQPLEATRLRDLLQTRKAAAQTSPFR